MANVPKQTDECAHNQHIFTRSENHATYRCLNEIHITIILNSSLKVFTVVVLLTCCHKESNCVQYAINNNNITNIVTSFEKADKCGKELSYNYISLVSTVRFR